MFIRSRKAIIEFKISVYLKTYTFFNPVITTLEIKIHQRKFTGGL